MLVLLVSTALGFAVAGVPRRGQDRPLSARPSVATTVDPTKPGVTATSATDSPTTTTAP
jgi:hypothetical protein